MAYTCFLHRAPLLVLAGGVVVGLKVEVDERALHLCERHDLVLKRLANVVRLAQGLTRGAVGEGVKRLERGKGQDGEGGPGRGQCT